MGATAYISNNWNRFDAVIVFLSLISFSGSVGGLATLFRIFRLARVLKLIPKAQGLMSVVMVRSRFHLFMF